MNPNEFKWETTGEGRVLNLRITETRDGSYLVENTKEPSQSYECNSQQELGSFLSQIQPSEQH